MPTVMAFQLIYTSSAHLLDSPLSGYGVVARSEHIPPALVQELVELSAYKPPDDQAIEGAQFSYTPLECAARTWHVLTSARPAGVDHHKRPCHLAHHIVLTDTEAQVYASAGTESPPSTPAGIILALELAGFWKRRWQSSPAIIDDDSFPLPIDCPSAERQPTWHIFTGSPHHAALLSSAPCTRSCLLLVPAGTRSRDILRLLHEGYALSSRRGWGMGFSTHGAEGDLTAGHLAFSTAGSPLHRLVQQGKLPIIDIAPGIAPPTAAAPAAPPEHLSPRKPTRHEAEAAPLSGALTARRKARSRKFSRLGWWLAAGAAILLAALAPALCTTHRPAAPAPGAEPPAAPHPQH